MNTARGVTLIDTLVAVSLLLIVFLGIFGAVQLSLDVVLNNKARAGAIALMNERMEYVRSLDYGSVGTVGGIPAGPIVQSESVTLSGIQYTRRTTIQYVDDPEDGQNSADQNQIIVDYKQVRIAVSWSSRSGERTVYMAARVEPLNGEEVNCSSPCGTLRIDVLNAANAPVSSARVQVVNSSVTPAVDVVTYTNTVGSVVLAGTPVGSGYAVSVSKTGYNSAQTYASSAENPVPALPNASIAQNQTSSVVFGPPDSGLDYMSTKKIYSYSAPQQTAWTDSFSGALNIASSTAITVSGGTAHLTSGSGYPLWGEFESVGIAPNPLSHWERFTWSGSTPAGTTLSFRFIDSNRALIPDTALPGNSAGFTSSVDLYGLSTTTYPLIAIRATLISNGSATPSVDTYSVGYEQSPAAIGNVTFSMRGAKKIGNSPVIYKYNQSGLQTAGSGLVALSNLEWDSYTITVPGQTYTLSYVCGLQPEYLAPAITQESFLYLTQASTAVVFAVTGAASQPVAGATVALSNGTFAGTTTSGACGHAFFSGIGAGSYTYAVSAAGYVPQSAAISVTGTSTKSVQLVAQ